MKNAGIQVDIVSAQKDKVKWWDKDHWSIDMPVDVILSDANREDYDALMIPGGVINPDKMRVNKDYVAFAKGFLKAGKPVAAICHGPQLLPFRKERVFCIPTCQGCVYHCKFQEISIRKEY